MEAILALSLLLGLSVCANVFQLFMLRNAKKRPKPTLAAEDLLHDLTAHGHAVIKVNVIDPANILLRSPKH